MNVTTSMGRGKEFRKHARPAGSGRVECGAEAGGGSGSGRGDGLEAGRSGWAGGEEAEANEAAAAEADRSVERKRVAVSVLPEDADVVAGIGAEVVGDGVADGEVGAGPVAFQRPFDLGVAGEGWREAGLEDGLADEGSGFGGVAVVVAWQDERSDGRPGGCGERRGIGAQDAVGSGEEREDGFGSAGVGVDELAAGQGSPEPGDVAVARGLEGGEQGAACGTEGVFVGVGVRLEAGQRQVGKTWGMNRAVRLAGLFGVSKNEGGDFLRGPAGGVGGACDGVAEHADESACVPDGMEGSQACGVGSHEGEGSQGRRRRVGCETVAHRGKGTARRSGMHAAVAGLRCEGSAAAGQSVQCAGDGAEKQPGALAREEPGWAGRSSRAW